MAPKALGMKSSAVLAVSLLLVLSCQAAEDSYSIEGRVREDSPRNRVGPLKVLLNGGESSALVRSDGRFAFRNVKPGSYILEVVSTDYMYRHIRVDVSQKRNGEKKVMYADDFEQWLSYPVVMEPSAPAQYFVPREQVSLYGMLANPMGIMICLMAFMVLVMPKMMDQEAMREMQEQMAESGQQPVGAGLLQNMMNPQAAAR